MDIDGLLKGLKKQRITLVDGAGNEVSQEQYERVRQSTLNFLGLNVEGSYGKNDLLEMFKKEEFSTVIIVDAFINNLLLALDKLHEENDKSERSQDIICNIIQAIVLIVKEKIANPLLEDNIKVNRYLLRRLKTVKSLWSVKQAVVSNKKLEKPSAAIIGLFCTALSDAKVRRIGSDTHKEFCIKVCSEFNLKYSDNVRQKLHKVPYSAFYVGKMRSLIYPSVDAVITDRIEEYLRSRPTK